MIRPRAEGITRIIPANNRASDFQRAPAEKTISDWKNLTWISVFSPSELWIYFMLQDDACGALKASIKRPVKAKIERQVYLTTV